MLQIRIPVFALVLFTALLVSRAKASDNGFYIMTAPVDRYLTETKHNLSLLPGEYLAILKEYQSNRHRLALLQLQELIRVGLPDGRMDAYLFLSGECYRALNLDKFASRFFHQLSEEYPKSPFVKQSLFRLMDDAYQREDENGIAFYFGMLMNADSLGEMGFAGRFIEGKRLYHKGLYAEAEAMLSRISDISPLRNASLFVRSLCALEQNNYEKAVLLLDAVIRETSDAELKDEALLTISQLYLRLKRMDKAEEFLVRISEQSNRYGDALILLSQIRLLKNDLENTILLGEKLLHLKSGEYMFEAAMVLESAYLRTHQDRRIDSLRTFLELSVRKKKLVFDLVKELDLLSEAQSSFHLFCQERVENLALLESKRRVNAVDDSTASAVSALREQDQALLKKLNAAGTVTGSSGVYDLRFLDALDRQIRIQNSRVDSLSGLLAALSARVGAKDLAEETKVMTTRDSIMVQTRENKELRDDIRKYSLGSNTSYTGAEEAQAKFVDWSMMHLDQMKSRLKEVYRESGKLSRETESPPPQGGTP